MEVQGRRKRGTLRRKEGDGNGSTGEKEERNTTQEGGRWEWKYKGEGREEHYVGRRVMGMEVQGRRKRGTLRRKEGDGNGSTREKEERNTT